MDLDVYFKIANLLALCGWLCLLTSPWFPGFADRVAGTIIPMLLAIAYCALMLVFWGGAEGGFDTLENVMRLFTQPSVVLAGWLHYLAFDLFIGAWEVRTAKERGLPFLLVVPCLVLTFMLGPAGFFLFSVLVLIRKTQSPAPVSV